MEMLNGRMRPAIQSREAAGKNGPRNEDPYAAKGVRIAFDHPTPVMDAGTKAWACADDSVDPEMFQPTDVDTMRQAQAFCGGCPARLVCLSLGLDRKESGVWGGVLLDAGRRLDEPKRPGRPNGNRPVIGLEQGA